MNIEKASVYLTYQKVHDGIHEMSWINLIMRQVQNRSGKETSVMKPR
jgi:hypothetical protein